MLALNYVLLCIIFVVSSTNEDGMSGLDPPAGHHDDHDHSHHDHDHSTIHKSSSSSSSSSSFSLNSKATFPVTAVLMTLASGSTAVVGGLLVVYFGVMSDRVLGHMLSFAAGVMLYISYGDILMHSIEDLDAAMSTAGASHDHHHHHHEDEEDGHGHTHGPGLFYANAFLFFGMAIYIFISLALKTLSGEGEGGHGHSHMNLGSTAVTASKESDNDDIIINSSSKRDKKIFLSATNSGLKQRRTSTATISEKSATTTTTAVEKRIVADVAGGEEGSFSSSESSKAALSAKLMRQGLMWTGLNAALGIAAHNLPEGLVVYNHTIGGICERNSASKDLAWWEFPPDPTVCLTRGVAMTFAIALHNIPEGMAVAAPIFAATESKWEAMKWCILSSLGEPIAAVLFGLFFSTGLTKFAMAAVNATTAGIMIALCLAELMPTAASLAGAQSAVISNVVGQLLMFGSIQFMRTSGVH